MKLQSPNQNYVITKRAYILYFSGLILIEFAIIMLAPRLVASYSLAVFMLLSQGVLIFRLGYCTAIVFKYLKGNVPLLYEKCTTAGFNGRVPNNYLLRNKEVPGSLDAETLKYYQERQMLQTFMPVPICSFIILALVFYARNGMLH